MLQRMGHAAFTVTDMEKSLDFYCNILGMTKAFELRRENGDPWIIYLKITTNQFLELFYGGKKKNEWDDTTVGYSHLSLEYDDIHQIADFIQSKGVEIVREIKHGVDGNWQCWIKDPDGNRIEIMQMGPDSPQRKA